MRLKLELIRIKIKNFLRLNYGNAILTFLFNNSQKIFQIFLEDIELFSKELYFTLQKKPERIISLFEFELKNLIKRTRKIGKNNADLCYFQIFLMRKFYNSIPKKIYEIKEGEFLSLRAIIISTGPLKIKAQNKNEIFNKEDSSYSLNQISKNNLNHNRTVGFSSFINTNETTIFFDYQIVIAKGIFGSIDNDPECIELILILEKNFVGKLFPGDEIFVSGIFIFSNLNEKNINKIGLLKNKKNILKVVGFSKLNFLNEYQNRDLYACLDKRFIKFARSRKIYNWIYSLIIPDIEGFIDLKQALSCLLFGGNEKILANDYIFRGQLNILFLGKKNEIFSAIKNYFRVLTLSSNKQSEILEKKVNRYDNKEIFDKIQNISFSDLNQICHNFSVFLIEKFENLGFKEQMILEEILEPKTLNGKHDFSVFFFHFISVVAFLDEKLQKNIYNYQTFSCEHFISKENLKKFDLVITYSEIAKLSVTHKSLVFTNSSGEKSGKTFNPRLEKLNKASLEFLKNYIIFVRKKFKPRLSKKASEFIKNAYVFLKVSKKKIERQVLFETNNIKHLESMIKISEAIGKMRMAIEVDYKDALEAIRIVQNFTI